jgi:hypothetical protein
VTSSAGARDSSVFSHLDFAGTPLVAGPRPGQRAGPRRAQPARFETVRGRTGRTLWHIAGRMFFAGELSRQNQRDH